MTRPSPAVPASLPSSCRVSRGDAQISPINGSCRSPRIRSGGPLSCPIFFPHQISTARGQDALAGQRCVTSSSPRRSCPHEALGWSGGWLPRGKPRGAEIPSKCLHPPFRAEASLEVQMVRICLQCWRPGFHPWVWKILWRREWAPTPVFLSGCFHGQRSLAGYSPWGRKESDTIQQLTHTPLSARLAGRLSSGSGHAI